MLPKSLSLQSSHLGADKKVFLEHTSYINNYKHLNLKFNLDVLRYSRISSLLMRTYRDIRLGNVDNAFITPCNYKFGERIVRRREKTSVGEIEDNQS